MDLTVETTDYGADDLSWLGSAHGFEAGEPVTLVSDLFHADHLAAGFVPSGVAIAKVTAVGANQNKYGRYDDAAADGRQVMVGHLKKGVRIKAGRSIGAAMLRHCIVLEANLPANHGLDAAGKADVAGRIVYR